MTPPLVSIVTACYNARSYIAEAVDSALTQTYPNCELVIVDDGSSDESAVILERYAQLQANRVRVIHQPNQGVSHSRMRAVQEARGEFVVPLDADDRLHSTAITEWMAYWQAHPHFALIYSPVYRIDAQGVVVALVDYTRDRPYEPMEGHILPTLLIGNVVYSMCLIRRQALLEVGGYLAEELDPRTGGEDYLLFLRLLAAGYEFGYVPRPLSYYRITPGGLSQDRKFAAESQIRVISHMMRQYPDAMGRAWYEGRQARERHFNLKWQEWTREAEAREQLLITLDQRLQDNEAERRALHETVRDLTARLAVAQDPRGGISSAEQNVAPGPSRLP